MINGIAEVRKGEKMDDLISRQAAIDAIKEEWDGCCSEYDATTIISDTTRAIDALPTVQPDTGMDKNLLINTIRAGITATNCKDVYSCGMRNGMRWCKALIDDKEPKFEDSKQYAQPDVPDANVGKWIPCSKKLPDNGGEYLVTWQGKKTGICQFINHDFRVYGENAGHLITAWQPLPEPYKEGD